MAVAKGMVIADDDDYDWWRKEVRGQKKLRFEYQLRIKYWFNKKKPKQRRRSSSGRKNKARKRNLFIYVSFLGSWKKSVAVSELTVSLYNWTIVQVLLSFDLLVLLCEWVVWRVFYREHETHLG